MILCALLQIMEGLIESPLGYAAIDVIDPKDHAFWSCRWKASLALGQSAERAGVAAPSQALGGHALRPSVPVQDLRDHLYLCDLQGLARIA